ncbi:hypothetical protein OPQ81_000656 [Rhizoctonia solani]|nr:hypothetical protein OPQ81_000656 [Rhizoctonia solani]
MTNQPVVIFDNGAHTIKSGLSTSNEDPRIVPNSVVRLKHERNKQFIGPEFNESLDYSISAIEFGDFQSSKNQPTRTQLSEWEFQSYYRCPSAALLPYSDIFAPGPQPECAVLVDSGFSFTHVIPVLIPTPDRLASIQWSSVRRLDVGGKLLTNHLKELVSFRHWDMTESTYIINQVKEACCFVSRNWARDLEICRAKKNPINQSYVLPNFGSEPPTPGYITTSPPQEDDTILPMNNERFSVPEILFTPSDIGISQVGLAGTIAHSINSLPEDLRGVAWGNIGLVGGNTLFDGFEQRLFDELRSLAPDEYEVCLYRTKSPITSTFHSARTFARSPSFPSLCVTREEYLEAGVNACRRKFASVNWMPTEEKDTGGLRKEKEGGTRKEGIGRGKGRKRKAVATSEEAGSVPASEAIDMDPKP